MDVNTNKTEIKNIIGMTSFFIKFCSFLVFFIFHFNVFGKIVYSESVEITEDFPRGESFTLSKNKIVDEKFVRTILAQLDKMGIDFGNIDETTFNLLKAAVYRPSILVRHINDVRMGVKDNSFRSKLSKEFFVLGFDVNNEAHVHDFIVEKYAWFQDQKPSGEEFKDTIASFVDYVNRHSQTNDLDFGSLRPALYTVAMKKMGTVGAEKEPFSMLVNHMRSDLKNGEHDFILSSNFQLPSREADREGYRNEVFNHIKKAFFQGDDTFSFDQIQTTGIPSVRADGSEGNFSNNQETAFIVDASGNYHALNKIDILLRWWQHEDFRRMFFSEISKSNPKPFFK